MTLPTPGPSDVWGQQLNSHLNVSLDANGKLRGGSGLEVIDATADDNSLKIAPTGSKSASTSVGGALNITMTSVGGAGLVVYSANAAPTGRLVVINANHTTFNQSALRVQHAGTGVGVDINHTGNGTALNIVGVAAQISTAQISGSEENKGTLKIKHTKPVSADTNAAVLSLEISGAGTACQGIFLDAVGNATTGNLLELRNNGDTKLRLDQFGYLVQKANSSQITTAGMPNSSFTWHLDETGNQLVLTVKYSGGTVKTANIALV